MNTIKTAVLLGLLSGLFLFVGDAIAGSQGLYFGLFLAVVTNFVSYFFSDKIALSMYGARPVTATENPAIWHRLYPMLESLCRRMEIPVPKLYVIPEASPNAFATGRNPSHASVAVTAGILELLSDQELEGVLAHELGHVLHRDILTSSVAATIASAITALQWVLFFGGGRDDEDRHPLAGFLMIFVAGFAAGLIQAAISRTREFSADAAAAKFTGTPYGLVNALQKLENMSRRIPMDANPATAHMFIVKPFTGESMIRLFSTHPSTEQRIQRLLAQR